MHEIAALCMSRHVSFHCLLIAVFSVRAAAAFPLTIHHGITQIFILPHFVVVIVCIYAHWYEYMTARHAGYALHATKQGKKESKVKN